MGQSPSSPVTYPPDFSLHFPSDTPTAPPTPAFTHPDITTSARPPPECPMHASSSDAPPPPRPKSKAAQCPVMHDDAKINPLNQMPTLSHERAPGQQMELPIDRTASTIPRPNADEKVWEYPSPQQFYNALVRKGWETPEQHVETMVDIHNFLNEEAWQEVLKWEKRFPRGEEAMLAKFQGNPGKRSPKAQLHLLAGKIFPSKFITEPPFDRHDWVVTRPSPDPNAPEIATRYVIDYYSTAEDADGNPVFFLDVRPALDSLTTVKERIVVACEETWSSYMGSSAEAGKKETLAASS